MIVDTRDTTGAYESEVTGARASMIIYRRATTEKSIGGDDGDEPRKLMSCLLLHNGEPLQTSYRLSILHNESSLYGRILQLYTLGQPTPRE